MQPHLGRSSLVGGLILLFLCCYSACSSSTGAGRPSPPVMPAALGRVNVEPALGKIISSVCSPTPDLKLNCPLYTGHQESFRRSGPEAAAAFNYTPDRGELVLIDQVSVTPPQVGQGGAVKLAVVYTILRPTLSPATIMLIREVRYRGQPALPASHLELLRGNGTFADEITLTLPSPLLPGPYTIVTKILGEKAFDLKEQSFILE